jgi:hypothetical protein
LAGLAVGWQQWASQETNLREKTIGLFKRCTDEKSGGETCDSISAIDCQTESDPDKCDESKLARPRIPNYATCLSTVTV